MNFELVIFDMDGLMVDTERITLDIAKEVIIEMKNKNLNEFTKSVRNLSDKELENFLDNFIRKVIGISDRDMCKSFKEAFGENFDFNKFLDEFRKKREKIYETGNIPVKEGLFELLQYLDNKGIKRIVASGSTRDVVEYVLKVVGADKYFDMAICGDEVSHGKPEPEIFIKAAQKAGVQRDKCLILEDSENGIRAAHSAKIKCIFIKDLVQPVQEVYNTIFKECKNLSEVIKYL